MDLLNAAILGLIQGLTEFLPVSSSAHLRIAGAFLGTGDDPGAAFTAITQLGTETAVIVYFWRDITRIIGAWFRSLSGKVPRSDPDARMGWFIILGSVPIVVLGLAFQTQIETTLRSLWIVAFTLIGFGIVLGAADILGQKERTLEKLTWPRAIIFGFSQALALIPGVSRSGATISAGLFPAVFGSGLYQLYKVVQHPCLVASDVCRPEIFTGAETAFATLIAGVIGFVVIAFFMRYISRNSFAPFVIYRILLGLTLVVLLSTGVLVP